MSRSFLYVSSAALLLTVFLTVDRTDALAQPAENRFEVPAVDERLEGNDVSQQHRPVTPNSDMLKEVDRARELIRRGKYTIAVEILQQQILDSPEDSFIDSQMRGTYKLQALDLIDQLPPEGKRAYEVQYGTIARQMLNDSLDRGDYRGVETVARRFFHTKAGHQAAYRLGCYYMDRSMPLAAVRLFERLRADTTEAELWEPIVSIRSALCWTRAGFPHRRFQILQALAKTNGWKTLFVGDQPLSGFEQVDQAYDWLIRRFRTGSESLSSQANGWPVFRGNPARHASSASASTLWDGEWSVPTLREPYSDAEQAASAAAVEEKIRELMAPGEQTDSVILPAVQPIVVGDVVVFRTLRSVMAADLHTGRLLWEAVMVDEAFGMLIDRLTAIGNASPSVAEDIQTGISLFLEQRGFQDLTTGTLCSDGERVFAVEATGFLDPYQIAALRSPFQPTTEAHNKIRAYDLKSGRLLWEVGGQRGEFELEMAGMFFLGPPLPLRNKLYCLVESGGEIGMAVLDSATGQPEKDSRSGRVRWQPLLTPEPSNMAYPLRHQSGLSPSYAEGIMVCPTAGSTCVALDLNGGMLLWGYHYPTTLSSEWLNQRFVRNWVSNRMSAESELVGWLDSSPCIVDGRVLLTPRDSDELHCLRLTDGRLLWKRPRDEGVFLACVHDGCVLVVEQNQLRAFSLANGKPLWKEPTPIDTPSGRGTRCGNLYHLPLSSGEIVTVDIRTGWLLGKAKSRNGSVHGNLVAANGTMVSQSPSLLIGFRALNVLEAQVAESLARDPDDAQALALRGRLKLHQGEVDDGLDDLRTAYAIDSAPATRELILTTVMEGLRLDFPKYSESLDELLKLTDGTDLQPACLRAYALGLEKAGDSDSAFAQYLKLADLDPVDESLERVSGSLSVRGDRWVRGRVGALYEQAAAEQRTEMDRIFHDRLTLAIQADGPEPIRRFLDHFTGTTATEDAVRELVGRLNSDDDRLELERHLRSLVQSNDPSVARFATALLAKLFIARGYGIQAEPLLKRLNGQWASDICLEGKTGRELVAEWRSGETPPLQHVHWPTANIKATRTNSTPPLQQRRSVEVVGTKGSFKSWNFSLEFARTHRNFIGQDGDGRERWKLPIQRPQNLSNDTNDYAQIDGHIMMLVLTNQLLILDLLDSPTAPKVLWTTELEGDDRDETQFAVGLALRFGMRSTVRPAAMTDELVCYQKGKKLFAAEVLTGKTLWVRSNVEPDSEIIADPRYVFVIEPDRKGVTVLSAADGRVIATRPLPEGFPMTGIGRYQLMMRIIEGHATLVLEDLLDGSRRWQRSFKPITALSRVGDDEFAVLDSNGQLVVLGIADGESRLTAKLDPKSLPKGGSFEILVIPTRERYIVLTSRPVMNPDVMGVSGRIPENPAVNGDVIAFDRKTGRKLWKQTVKAQSVDLNQPQDLPVLVFASRMRPDQPAGVRAPYLSVLVMDKRSGEIIYSDESTELVAGYQVDADPEDGRVHVQFYRSALTILFSDKPPVDPASANEPDQTSDNKDIPQSDGKP